MEVIALIIICAFLYWLFILRPGRLDFWKVAGKYPDKAYDLFKSHECCMVFEGELPKNHRKMVPKENWTGPFRVWIPKLGNKVIYVFGKCPDFEETQKEFIAETIVDT